MQIFLNGSLINTGTFTANTAAREYGTTAWYIGAAIPGAANYSWAAKAIIDDVRIYNRVISADEVQTLYSQGGSQGVIITKWVEAQ